MKATVVPAAGKRWEVKAVRAPKPDAGEVPIRIRASGNCYTERREP